MHGALHVAKTGLSAQDTQLKVISNNLANANTVGFKKDRLEFEDLLYQVRRQPGAATGEDSQLPSGLQLGSGVRTVGTQKMFQTGDLQITDQPFDVAINGRGFIQVTQPNGDAAYTRNGTLHLDGESRLVTAEGYLIEPAITLPEGVTNFSVGGDGTVSVSVAGDPNPVELGQLELADFANPQGLQAIGQNLFIETAASGAPVIGVAGEDGLGMLQQGVLEGSNVNAVEELVNMITTQRAYEMNSKVISTADEMLGYVSQQL
ncbi:MAG: flagellar basal-body rod protein FlgG [Oceanospirillales bacterium]|uniref:Flagellar basal-body rod protein FlgG n=1 Tax=Marinobacterium halophilum TaxID=267374 RepID=A0A2P8ES69_9GAMM|nr:flagellar basal-body rod protein FlgG [Marinobacterium halophilum]MBR9827671.1 flagellar basal-body rod protein FlgG [Oceanospirillales bacterium]PSL12336.1 flagellar basal-body rod protein FlgG [Marinobacterium halophilum]